MAIDPADLIRRFEPILYFHQDENFFPSDAKRYLEHCALWRVENSTRDNKAYWGGTSSRTFPHFPEIARNHIAVSADELGQASEERADFGSIDLTEDADTEHFLDPAGWKDADRVDASTDNRYADLVGIQKLYSVGQPLAESQFWYHAELFTADQLKALLPGRPQIVSDFFGQLRDPLLLCYYLFFPGHEAPLEGCNGDDKARFWASFAGEWACVAILLQGDGNHSHFQATHIGLTSRNAGVIQYLGQEIRIGMRIFDANLLTKIIRPSRTDAAGQPLEDGEHFRVYVAKGTHGLYDSGAQQLVPGFSPDDISGQSCGVYETINEKNDAIAKTAEDKDARTTPIVYKTVGLGVAGLATSAVGSGFNPLAVAWAFAYSLAEGMVIYGGMAGLAGGISSSEAGAPPPQFDHPPAPNEIKFVVGPPSITIPDAKLEFTGTWPRPNEADESVVTTSIDGRSYSLFVGTAADPSSRPIWLPGGGGSAGFQGRWGNRVQHDPFSRRAGMKFPDFAGMFFDGLGK